MVIVDSRKGKIKSFSLLETGQVFEFEGIYYMVVDNADYENFNNCVRLDNGLLECIPYDAFVTILNAELQISQEKRWLLLFQRIY